MTVIPFPPRLELSSAAPPAIATDALAAAEAAAEAGFPGQKESELDVVRALLRLIFSPNVRMPLSRLQ
jgi:hypothetical protein